MNNPDLQTVRDAANAAFVEFNAADDQDGALKHAKQALLDVVSAADAAGTKAHTPQAPSPKSSGLTSVEDHARRVTAARDTYVNAFTESDSKSLGALGTGESNLAARAVAAFAGH